MSLQIIVLLTCDSQKQFVQLYQQRKVLNQQQQIITQFCYLCVPTAYKLSIYFQHSPLIYPFDDITTQSFRRYTFKSAMRLSKSFQLIVSARSRSLEHVLDVAAQLAHCLPAVVHLHIGQTHNHYLQDEDHHTDEDREVAESGFVVFVASPGGRPVYNPDEVDEQGYGHEVPDSGFLFDVGVVPEEDDEGEEGEVVVWSFEVGEETQDYNCHEQFVKVLNHSIQLIIFKRTPT